MRAYRNAARKTENSLPQRFTHRVILNEAKELDPGNLRDSSLRSE